MDNNKKRCGICGKPIGEEDDIVYCPDCATPMHRECWQETRCCPNEDKHGSGFDWNKEQEQSTQSKENRGEGEAAVICDICGNEITDDEDKVVCPICATPMHRECWRETLCCPNEDKHLSGYDWNDAHEPGNAPDVPDRQEIITDFYNLAGAIADHPLKSRETGEELTCCGVKQWELIRFLGADKLGTPRIFAVFMNLANGGRKLSLNIFAGLLMPWYQFYRRMTGPALILTIVEIILSLPSTFAMFYGNAMLSIPNFITIVNAFALISFVIKVAVFIFNDYIYMKWSVGKILSLRERYKEESKEAYSMALERAGKPGMMGILVALGIYLALFYVLKLALPALGIVG